MSSQDDNNEPPEIPPVDWDIYAKYRPSYPPATTKLIMDYHRAHSNSLRLAHDMGSGSGSYAQTLSDYFQHVHVSDPNLENLSKARERLTSWYNSNWWKAKFTFSQTAGEQADTCVAEGSVDLCTLMMSAHWCGSEAMVDAVARSLAPNGTLCAVQYNPCPRVVGNGVVGEAVRRMYTTWGNVTREKSMKAKELMRKNNSPLDSIELPEGPWIQDVTKRIKINAHGKGDEHFIIPGQEDLVAESRVGSEQRKYWFDEGADKEAEGWRMEVGREWFRGHLKSLRQEQSVMGLYEEDLAVVEREVGEGRVCLEWSVAVLLATRK